MTKTTLFAALLSLSACFSGVRARTYDSTIRVDVFRAPHLPECRYDEIGEIQWLEDRKGENIEQARKLAFENGASIIVINESYADGASTEGAGIFLLTSLRNVRVAAMAKWHSFECRH